MFLKTGHRSIFFPCIFFVFLVVYTPSRTMNKEATKLSKKEQNELNRKLLECCVNRELLEYCSVYKYKPLFPNLEKAKSLLEKAKRLIEKGANINCQDKFGWTPLHRAVCSKNMEIIKYLLEKKAEVNVMDKWGETPIFKIILGTTEKDNEQDFLGIVKILCKNGARVDLKNKNGHTLVGMVMYGRGFGRCPKGLFDVAKYLEKKGAKLDVNEKFREDKVSLLHEAVRERNVEKVKYLLSKGANIEAKNIYGQTPLVHAAHFGGDSFWDDCSRNISILNCFLKYKANIYTLDNEKHNVLHAMSWANISRGHLIMAKWFIDKGISLNSKDAKGYTVIDLAARYVGGYYRFEFIMYLFTQAIAQDLKDKQPNYIKKLAEKLLRMGTLSSWVQETQDAQDTFKNMFCLEAKRKNASLELIKYFFKIGFKIDKGGHTHSSLYYAIKNKQKFAFVKLFFEKSNKIEKETIDMLIKNKKKYIDLFCKKEDKCPICLNTFKSKQFVWLIKACKHFFCKDCIEKWEAKSIDEENKQTPCPMCRKKFTHNDLKKRVFFHNVKINQHKDDQNKSKFKLKLRKYTKKKTKKRKNKEIYNDQNDRPKNACKKHKTKR
ncbi:ankyrin repeat domain-containing protein [Candidatus Dependentiae bacterium]